MTKKSLCSRRRKSTTDSGVPAGKRREFKPIGESLEGRALLAAATVISAVAQHGVPSVFAIGSTGNVNYNFLTSVNGQPAWNGWVLVPGGLGATTISTGTLLVPPSSIPQPFVVLVNGAQNVYYDAINSTGNFAGWSPVGINVGAVSIATGTGPLNNSPYVVMINGSDNIYYNSLMSNGAWAGWSPVGVNVGAVQVSTGVIQTSLAPAVFEPYVVMLNGAGDVWYTARNQNGTWQGFSPVGLGVGAASISTTTIANRPNVSLLNTAGNVYLNVPSSSGAWLGWSTVGAGTGSGATPAVASSVILADFNNYEFALNGSGQLFSAFGIYGQWSKWFSVGTLPAGVTTSAFTATAQATTAPFAFAFGSDGNVYWIDQSSWATWTQFASLGAPG
jgi:hypothetical protein